ncbi:hypothetical protein [Amycolatopsis sp. M39]|uniref:hypothetical protein n=1 Tax=Amycolatopsis sp. M39 TaxID=1825094 RepID=UPI0012FFC2D5|nr:hypothetical protein [Amycolatopsis sp. M39]
MSSGRSRASWCAWRGTRGCSGAVSPSGSRAFDALPSPELVVQGRRVPQYTVLFGEIIDIVLPDVLNTP